VYVQLSVQIFILLLARTETATTGGLETIFDQTLFGLDPYTLLVISISWSLLSCVWTHTNLVAIEKGGILSFGGQEMSGNVGSLFVLNFGLL